jgi:hypothetical protein
LAGDSGRGLYGPPLEQWAGRQPYERVRELFRREVELAEDASALMDAGHVECQASHAKAAREAMDDGRRFEEVHDPATCPVLLRAAAAVRSKIEAHGIEPGTLEAVNLRISALAAALKVHYRTQGEPAELVKLRGEIARAKAATWPPAKALREARERYSHVGAAIAEADVMKAAAELKVVEDAHQAAQRRLWSEFGVQA